jgi:hypothetical protein
MEQGDLQHCNFENLAACNSTAVKKEMPPIKINITAT